MGIINRNTITIIFFGLKSPFLRSYLTRFFGILTALTTLLLISTKVFHFPAISNTARDQWLPFFAITFACLWALSLYSIIHSVTDIFALLTIIGIILLKVVKTIEPVPLWRQFLPVFTIAFGFLLLLSLVSLIIYQVQQ